jgi:asparagine synthase (glutamine-hydrolysing)
MRRGMCGIAGIVATGNGHRAFGDLAEVSRLLRHRGPDDEGILVYPADGAHRRVALIHRRLSILDLSSTGHQPMESADGRYVIVFNGEIYNYVELRAKLEHLGHRFSSSGDTQVLLAAYAQWGDRVLDRLTGMFAFAILDKFRHRLFLARDPFGIKPLYYAFADGAFTFASELRALLAFSSARRRVDPDRLYRYLRYGLTDEGRGTLIAGIHQLPAANYAEVDIDAPGLPEPTAYWEPQALADDGISFNDAAERLRELFLQNIALHLRSDVPIGTALSGGIDSSSIIAGIRAVAPQAEIHAFSYVPDDPALSEERWIELAAGSARADVHKVRVGARDLRTDLQVLGATQGEPFGSTSIYAQYSVFREAARCGIKVMLDGQGADELLGGYRQYYGARMVSLIRQGRIREARTLLRKIGDLPGVRKSYVIQKVAEHLTPPAAQKYLRKLVGKELMPSWMNQNWFRRAGVIEAALDASRGKQALKEDLVRDLTRTSLPALLRYEDRNSMAFSIESRVPFLTRDMAEFVLRLPEAHIIDDAGTTKAVFRSAMRGLVPDAILDRKDKIGFSTPESEWLQSMDTWARPMFESEAAQSIPALNLPAARALWENTLSGERPFDYQLWRMLNLIQWTMQFGTAYG